MHDMQKRCSRLRVLVDWKYNGLQVAAASEQRPDKTPINTPLRNLMLAGPDVEHRNADTPTYSRSGMI
jgi:hypothetical protein